MTKHDRDSDKSTSSLPIIDSHCHLTLVEEREPAILQELAALDASKLMLLDVGLEPGDLHQRMERYKDIGRVYFSVGLHPNYSSAYTTTKLRSNLEPLIPLASAVGECGLDWLHMKSDEQTQRALFRIHIELALKHAKPIIIHSRNSLSDVLDEVENVLARSDVHTEHLSNHRGIIHCFSGTAKDAERCMALGFFISFAANVSYKANDALREILQNLPSSRLLLETDAPYLSHQSIRGKINHPKHLPLLYETVASIRKIDQASLVEILQNNLCTLLQEH